MRQGFFVIFFGIYLKLEQTFELLPQLPALSPIAPCSLTIVCYYLMRKEIELCCSIRHVSG